jgi:flagellar M-ring protein FliF
MEFKTLLDQITSLFQNFTLKQRIVVAISILFVIGCIVFLLLFRTKDSMIGSGYSVLFEQTSPSDSALIIQQLEKDNVPYKIVNEGTIAIPSAVVYKQRISIAASIDDMNGESFSSDLVKSQIKYKRDFEGAIEEKIINVLAPVVGGVDKVVAKITIDFDFAREDSTSEVYDPNSVARSKQSAKETYEKSSTTTNYEISKKVTQRKEQFATIKKLSAAVVVDGDYEVLKNADGSGADTLSYIALSATQMASIKDIVKQAMGFNTERGDEVTVSNFEFKPLAKDRMKSSTQTFIDQFTYYASPLFPVFKYLIAGILLFVFYKKVIHPLKEKMTDNTTEVSSVEDMKIEEEDSAEDTLEKFKRARKKVEDQLGIHNEFSEEEVKYDILLKKLKDLTESKSEEVADLLQAMIRDEGDYNKAGINS